MEDRSTVRKATREPTGDPVVLAEALSPPLRTEAVHLSTTASNEFWDLTKIVREVVSRSRVQSGQVTIYTPHTTSTIVVNESETGFHNDYRRLLAAIVPEDGYFEHDDHTLRTENLQEDEFINGHAHCRQLLTGQASVTIPIVEGEVLLGQWQRVMFLELDQARERRAFIHSQGV